MDPIDRQDAIRIVDSIDTWQAGWRDNAIESLKALPPTQPERLTDDDFETIRIHLSAYKERLCNQHRWKEAEEYQKIINRLMSFASAQPEPEIYWGYTPTYERPLADVEIVPRLRDIQKQIPGGSYAIDRAIEIIEAVAERRTDD